MFSSREELAWAGGFYSGEGCTQVAFSRKGTKDYVVVRVTTNNTHYPNLVKLQKAVGGLGKISGPIKKQKWHYKPCWNYMAQSFEEAQAIIAYLWEFLSDEKKQQAEDALLDYHQHRKDNPVKDTKRRVAHGTLSEYTNHKCRCDLCKKAASEYNRKRYLNSHKYLISK